MRVFLLSLALIICVLAADGHAAKAQVALVDMSIEELGEVIVTSVSRRPERVSEAPASIYVITGEEIRRSGATTLAEALRLAPNLQVARINAGRYAITARGFNSDIANKLLVLIDGRTVYSPLFSGVFWDMQSVVLPDVERIEVIDGPGAATWGINAVNGVVNVITRSARETQGTMIRGGAGTHQHLAVARYGATLGTDGAFRVYAKGVGFEALERASGEPGQDAWRRGQIGFRADWGSQDNALMVTGELFRGDTEDRPVFGEIEISGAHLLGRWERSLANDARLQLQAFYDRTERHDRFLLQEESELADLELRYSQQFGAHAVQWGGGYRHAWSKTERQMLFRFIPADRELSWAHVFVQDQWSLSDTLDMTLGSRFEHNDYTGWEMLPSLRLGWRPSGRQLFWSAVSRAVRAPARLDRELFAPPDEPFFLAGGPDFESEVADVYELGYRAQPAETVSLSVTAFHSRYDQLRTSSLTSSGNFIVGNEIKGEVQGIETWGKWQVTPNWRLSWGATLLDRDLRLKSAVAHPSSISNLGNDPDYKWSLRSRYDLGKFAFDLGLRRVDELPNPLTPAYTAVEMRLGWQLLPDLELSLVMENLFDPEHLEFSDSGGGTEIERTALLTLIWQP